MGREFCRNYESEEKMNEKLIHKSKWFWHWEDDKEEAWLEQMARQGLHLVKASTFGQYFFARGEARDMVYRLDFVQSNKKDEAYFQLFRDAGWEHAGEMLGWQYWRKEVKPGETPEIFTDIESKVRKYQRLRGFLAIVFLPVAMYIFNMRTFFGNRMLSDGWIDWVFTGIAYVFFALFILYIYIFIRIGLRIRRLRGK
jgi:hypothetical protein